MPAREAGRDDGQREPSDRLLLIARWQSGLQSRCDVLEQSLEQGIALRIRTAGELGLFAGSLMRLKPVAASANVCLDGDVELYSPLHFLHHEWLDHVELDQW